MEREREGGGGGGERTELFHVYSIHPNQGIFDLMVAAARRATKRKYMSTRMTSGARKNGAGHVLPCPASVCMVIFVFMYHN